VLDYSVRVSTREAYIAPDRGAQGNPIKTMVARPFVLDGTEGKLTIAAQGIVHTLLIQVDPIGQEPQIKHGRDTSVVKSGTSLTVASWLVRDGLTAV
jgi:hypothetical protein